MKRIYIGALAILTTFAIALPSAKPVSIYVTQVMHNSRKAEADRLFKLGEQQIKNNQPKAALESFQKALPIYQQIKERFAEGHTHKSIANAYYFLKDYPQAIAHQQKALDIAKEIKNPDLEARALLNLGVFNAVQGNMSSAIGYLIQSLAIVRGTGYANAKNTQNPEMQQKGLSALKTAIDLSEKSLVNIREKKDKHKEIDILLSLGKAYTVFGENSKAIASFEQALAIARELKDTQLETNVLQSQGQALVNITNSYIGKGDYTNAIKYSQELIAIARKIKNPPFEFAGLGYLASAYTSTGNLQQAVKIREEQQKIFEKNEAPWVALVLGGQLAELCNNYWLLEDYSKAISCNEKGLKIVQKYQSNPNYAIKISNRIYEFNHLLGLGTVYQKINQPQESIKFFELARAIYPEIKNNPFFASNNSRSGLLTSLGVSYLSIGDTNKAIEYFQQQLSNATGNILEQGKAHLLLGSAYIAQNKYDVGQDHFNQAIKIAQDNREQLLELQAYRVLSASYDSIGNLDKAVEYEEKALKVAQKLNNCSIQHQNNLPSQPTQDFFHWQLEQGLLQGFDK